MSQFDLVYQLTQQPKPQSQPFKHQEVDNEPKLVVIAHADSQKRLAIKDAIAALPNSPMLMLFGEGKNLFKYLNHLDEFAQESPCENPSLLLLDEHLSGMDGCEALTLIRQNPDLRATPVVMMGQQQPHYLKEAYQLGVNSYIVLPQSLDGLSQLIQTVASYWLQTNYYTNH